MRRKKILIQPTLRDRKGDLSKKWYVEMAQRNPHTDEMVYRRFEVLDNVKLNHFQTADERRQFAQRIVEDLQARLKKGWSIFVDTERYVYEDQTIYSNEARFFKKAVESNSNVQYWASRYIKEVVKENGLSKDTVSTYVSRFRTFGAWIKAQAYDRLDIVGIDNDKIIAFFTHLKYDRNLSARTYRGYMDLLNVFFDFIKQKKAIAENPVHSLPVNRNNKDMGAERIRHDDMSRLMRTIDSVDRQLGLACRFEYYCGLRPGYEVRFLKIGDIDFRRGYSKVRVVADNSKVSRKRIVAIPDVFLDYLLSEWQLNTYNSDLYVFGKNNEPGSKHLGKNTLRFRFVAIRKRLGLPPEYKFYSMKHTGAVALAEEGEAIINIRDHLGHTSIHTTEHYLKRLGFNESKIIHHNFPKI